MGSVRGRRKGGRGGEGEEGRGGRASKRGSSSPFVGENRRKHRRRRRSPRLNGPPSSQCFPQIMAQECTLQHADIACTAMGIETRAGAAITRGRERSFPISLRGDKEERKRQNECPSLSLSLAPTPSALAFSSLLRSLSSSSPISKQKTHSSLGLSAARDTERAWKGRAELGILAPELIFCFFFWPRAGLVVGRYRGRLSMVRKRRGVGGTC